jgi:hypothetical protein
MLTAPLPGGARVARDHTLLRCQLTSALPCGSYAGCRRSLQVVAIAVLPGPAGLGRAQAGSAGPGRARKVSALADSYGVSVRATVPMR